MCDYLSDDEKWHLDEETRSKLIKCGRRSGKNYPHKLKCEVCGCDLVEIRNIYECPVCGTPYSDFGTGCPLVRCVYGHCVEE